MKTWMREHKKVIGVIIFAICVLLLSFVAYKAMGSERIRRSLKTLQSEYGGGLQRTVTVYDNNGKVLKEWEGKIDIEENSYGNKVLFDLDGKRKTVYNAIVIVEEE